MANEAADEINLGSSIKLTGFRDLDGGKVVVLKKIIGNHVRKISENCQKFENIEIVMKPVGPESADKYELHAKLLDNGKIYSAEETDRNLFVVVDKVLSKIHSSISK